MCVCERVWVCERERRKEQGAGSDSEGGREGREGREGGSGGERLKGRESWSQCVSLSKE